MVGYTPYGCVSFFNAMKNFVVVVEYYVLVYINSGMYRIVLQLARPSVFAVMLCTENCSKHINCDASDHERVVFALSDKQGGRSTLPGAD